MLVAVSATADNGGYSPTITPVGRWRRAFQGPALPRRSDQREATLNGTFLYCGIFYGSLRTCQAISLCMSRGVDRLLLERCRRSAAQYRFYSGGRYGIQ